MTNPGDSDEWWKQYGGEGVSPEAATPGSVPQYPTAEPPGYPSAPQYPQQSAPQYPQQSAPQYPQQSAPQYPQQSAPQYPQQPAPQLTPPPQPQYPAYQAPQPGAQAYPPPPNYGYQNAYQPYGYPQPQGTSGMAIGALISSLIGFVTCGIGSIVGIILGVVALNQIKQSGQEGRGMALAGIWVGVGVIVLSVLWFVIILIGSS
ncbi:DUF4190 domain-containing protein [Nocardia sp. KC 131]|uniref:DUF4190 domain-containing protein n=1 Tax=Nocardia arseniciresistens TaxID=3392119 RepID=UPI00398ED996